MMKQLGFVLSYEETETMWLEISDEYSASFLSVPRNLDELVKYLECIEV